MAKTRNYMQDNLRLCYRKVHPVMGFADCIFRLSVFDCLNGVTCGCLIILGSNSNLEALGISSQLKRRKTVFLAQ